MKSLDKGLRLLDCFSSSNEELSVSQISRMMDENKSTVFSLLYTLKKRGFIYQNPETNKYKLGIKLLELGGIVQSSIDVRDIILPYLQELVDKFTETAHLVIWDGTQGLYLERVEGTNAMRMTYRLGHKSPMHCTANGKAVLSCLSTEEIIKYIHTNGMPRYTENTITDYGELLKELASIKEKGYAVDNEEEEIGVRCVAVPILDYRGEVLGALSISGSSARITEDKIPEIVAELKQDKAEIESILAKSKATRREIV